jgi:hypothetical protein
VAIELNHIKNNKILFSQIETSYKKKIKTTNCYQICLGDSATNSPNRQQQIAALAINVKNIIKKLNFLVK